MHSSTIPIAKKPYCKKEVMDQVTRDTLKQVRKQLTEMEIVKDIAFGVDEAGYYYLPVIKIGYEHRASEIPSQINGVQLQVRYERDE